VQLHKVQKGSLQSPGKRNGNQLIVAFNQISKAIKRKNYHKHKTTNLKINDWHFLAKVLKNLFKGDLLMQNVVFKIHTHIHANSDKRIN